MNALRAVYFFYFAFVGLFAPYFGLYLQWLGQTAFQIGLLLSVMQLVRVLAPNAWAALADRSGQRVPYLRGTLALSAVCLAGLFAAHGFWGLLLVLSALGLCSSAPMPLVEALTLARLKDRLAGYGSIRLWGSVGFIVAVMGAGWALDRIGIATLPWMLLAAVLATFAAALAIREARLERPRERGAVWPLLARPQVGTLMAACFLMCAAHGPLYSFYSIYLDANGYSKGTIGLLWTIGVIAEIAVFVTMPGWMRRVRPESVLAASFGLAVIRFLMIGWGVESFAVLVLAQVLHGATFGSYHIAALAVVNGWFSGHRQVRGQAMFTSLSYGAGGFLGSVASGALWEAAGPAWTFTAGGAAAALGFALLVHRGRLLPAPAAVVP